MNRFQMVESNAVSSERKKKENDRATENGDQYQTARMCRLILVNDLRKINPCLLI